MIIFPRKHCPSAPLYLRPLPFPRPPDLIFSPLDLHPQRQPSQRAVEPLQHRVGRLLWLEQLLAPGTAPAAEVHPSDEVEGGGDLVRRGDEIRTGHQRREGVGPDVVWERTWRGAWGAARGGGDSERGMGDGKT